MATIKSELLAFLHVEGYKTSDILCLTISMFKDVNPITMDVEYDTFTLKVGYKPLAMHHLLHVLNGYDCEDSNNTVENVHDAIIWLTNGSWIKPDSCTDGTYSYWTLYNCPVIPCNLR